MKLKQATGKDQVNEGDYVYLRARVECINRNGSFHVAFPRENAYLVRSEERMDALLLIPEPIEVLPCTGDCSCSGVEGLCDDRLEALERALAAGA